MQTRRIVLVATLLALGGGVGFLSRALEREAFAQPLPACSDGIDNDGDLLVDLADPGCAASGPEGISELDPSDFGVGMPDLVPTGPQALGTGFSEGEGGTTGATPPNPATRTPNQPARDEGCAYAGRGAPSSGLASPGLASLLGLIALGLLRLRRRAT